MSVSYVKHEFRTYSGSYTKNVACSSDSERKLNMKKKALRYNKLYPAQLYLIQLEIILLN